VLVLLLCLHCAGGWVSGFGVLGKRCRKGAVAHGTRTRDDTDVFLMPLFVFIHIRRKDWVKML
jgi:hypothetical protein